MSEHHVKLTPVTQNGQQGWEMEYDGVKGNSPSSYPAIKVGKGSKDVKIEFTIHDGGNITFVPKDQKPIYVQEIDPTTPKKPAKGVVNYQFEVEKVSQDGKTLVVKDKNGSQATYSYELNFLNASPLDPIITNGGGGNKFYDAIQANPIVAGAVLLLLVAGIYVLFRRKNVAARPGG